MGRRLIIGTTVTAILGFILFQIGLLVIIGHPSFLRDSLGTVILDSNTLDLLSVALMFGGGIIVVVSILQVIQSIPKNLIGTVYAQQLETAREIETLKATLADALALKTRDAEAAKPSRTCKFCGAKLEENAVYCPNCDRAQI